MNVKLQHDTRDIFPYTTISIEEENENYISHDRLFKHLIHTYFEEFLELFFPEVHDQIDFDSITPLSEEVFTDIFGGEYRRADIVIETKIKGQDTVMIIHVEPQSTYEKNFQKRMYLYFSLLYNRYRKPILPIVIYSYEARRSGQEQYTMDFPFFHVLTFNFMKVELSTMDWRKYLKSNNPVAAALLSKMGYSKSERIQVKKEFLRMITRMELSDADTGFIIGFFERYLSLEKAEEEKLMKEITHLDESKEIMQLPISWVEQGKEIGREEGSTAALELVAKELLAKGLATEFIVEVTKLNEARIEELRQQQKEK